VVHADDVLLDDRALIQVLGASVTMLAPASVRKVLMADTMPGRSWQRMRSRPWSVLCFEAGAALIRAVADTAGAVVVMGVPDRVCRRLAERGMRRWLAAGNAEMLADAIPR
jgi:hypothetical protein